MTTDKRVEYCVEVYRNQFMIHISLSLSSVYRVP